MTHRHYCGCYTCSRNLQKLEDIKSWMDENDGHFIVQELEDILLRTLGDKG